MSALSLPSDPGPPLAPGVLRRVRKYVKIMRVSLSERLTYRFDFILSTLLRFLPMVTTILLWQAVFVGQTSIAGFDRNEMIAYLLLVHIGRMFSSMPGLAAGIARDIRDGSLKKYLLQPIDMLAYLVAYRVAHKIAYIITSALPYGLLFFLCRGYFDRFPDALTLLAYLVSLFMGFLVGFFFEACIGTAGFWFLEVTSFLYVINTVNFFISGQMFPLDLLPPFWSGLLKALPFQYMAYFPTMIFLGKIHGMQLVWGLLGELAWALGFILIARLLYKAGLRRYSAYGG
ncbi:MAG TPA: ABC-2 family transporter protein [Gemmataceae bacterium]|nr:ABC-2 family transporter protein [Gemmataceae bacterium]